MLARTLRFGVSCLFAGLLSSCESPGSLDVAVGSYALGGPSGAALTPGSNTTVIVDNRCSGTLIGPNTVLTAAHCGADPELGFSNVTMVGVSQPIEIIDCIPHPKAYKQPGDQDGDCHSRAGSGSVFTQFDVEVLRLANSFAAEPRSIGPPRSCFGDAGAASNGTLAIQQGWGGGAANGTGLSELAVSTLLLDNANVPEPFAPNADIVDLDAPDGFFIEMGDSGGPTIDPGSGSVYGVFSDDTNDRAAFMWNMEGDSPIRWLIETVDPNGDCALGSANPCLFGGRTEPLPDSDGDGLPDMFDLCPEHFIASSPCGWNHCDSDGDFVGDECDACDNGSVVHPELGSCDHRDSDDDGVADGCDACPLGRTGAGSGSADFDEDSIPNECDLCPDVPSSGACGPLHCDTDGDGVGDECDNCPDAANALQDNCNADIEQKLGSPEMGDICDNTPCAETEVLDELLTIHPEEDQDYVPQVWVDARQGIPGEGGIDEFDFRTGFRFCTCSAADGQSKDTVATRADCEDDQGDGTGLCLIALPPDLDIYEDGKTAEDLLWKNVTLGTTEVPLPADLEIIGTGLTEEYVLSYELYQEGAFHLDVAATWDLLTDHARWQSFDPNLPPVGGGGTFGGVPLHGVMWTRTPARAVEPPPPPPGVPPPPPFSTEQASHYWSGSVYPPQVLPAAPKCLLEPFAPAVVDVVSCPVCDATFPRPFVGIQGVLGPQGSCGAPSLCEPMINVAGNIFVTPDFASEPIAVAVTDRLCSPGPDVDWRWVAPSEPPQWVRDPSVIYVAVRDDASGFGPLIERIGGDPAVREIEPIAPPAACGAARSGHLAVLSAQRETLYVGGGFDDQGHAIRDLCALDLATETWRDLPLPAFPRPEQVLAATYSPADDALYVLDVVPHLGTAPDGDCTRTEEGGLTYWACDNARSWDDARDRCGAVGMSLVEIDDIATNDVVEALLQADSWIGGSDSGLEGDWRWIHGTPFWSGGPSGEAISFANWASGQPNDFGVQDCTRMRKSDGRWQDEHCWAFAPYVCEGHFSPDPGEAFAALESQATSGLSCGGAQGLPWPMRGGCGNRLGRSDFVGPQAGVVQWSTNLGLAVKSSPVIGTSGTIYVGSGFNKLYAVGPDGTIKWSYLTGGDVDSSPALGIDGSVYFGSDDNKLRAVDAETGALQWTYTIFGDIDSSPAIGADGTVYFGSDDNKIYAVTAAGSLLWSYGTFGDIDSSPAIGPDGTIYVGSDDKYLYALRPEPGLSSSERLVWKTHLGLDIDTTPLVSPDGFIYVGSDANKLYKLDAQTGDIVWSFYTVFDVNSSPALLPDGAVVFGDDAGKVWALETDGTVRWSRHLWGSVKSSPVVGADGTVYVGADDNKVHALRPEDGTELWWVPTFGDVQSSPAIGENGVLYVGSDGGKLYAIGSPDDPAAFPEKVRLLRIPALGGSAEVVRSWIRQGSNDRYAIAVDPAGDLLVAASAERYGWHYVVHLQRQPDRDMLVAGYRIGAGALLDTVAQADQHGVSFPIVRANGTASVVGYRKQDMTTVGLQEITPRVF